MSAAIATKTHYTPEELLAINPKTRTVRVHRSDGSLSYLHEDEELSGDDVIPGFRCLVRDIFPPRGQPAVAAPPTP
jgi:hypothetical protein